MDAACGSTTSICNVLAPDARPNMLSAKNFSDCPKGALLLSETEESWLAANLEQLTAKHLSDLSDLPFSTACVQSLTEDAASTGNRRSQLSRVAKRPRTEGVVKRTFGQVRSASAALSLKLRSATGAVKVKTEVKDDSEEEKKVKVEVKREREEPNGARSVKLKLKTEDTEASLASAVSSTASSVDAKTAIPFESLEVLEALDAEERDAAFKMHLSKNTFHEERELVKFRIYRGDECGCRTWVLAAPRHVAEPVGLLDEPTPARAPAGRGRRGRRTSKPPDSVSERTYLAAATVRLNVYRKQQAWTWAQILNMSTKRERQGLGTALIAGLEELLRHNATDVVLLYPADNGRAPSFWASIGYSVRSPSLLPQEELASHDEGGPLLPEFDPGTLQALPRWEKRICDGVQGSPTRARNPARAATRRAGSRGSGMSASDSSCRVGGEQLRSVYEALMAQRVKYKAEREKIAADKQWELGARTSAVVRANP
eukprot:gnl/TRDRNA2_/TRDRNA2_38563_c0_seq1.p1 gnl/TRDRNA2_/TRDRNA2_38563_c0~~gnl/TRDRNA2_/TRDRNA2_38563_c0_seq1.p1  ORF type:complete len:486 (+),score=89.74 gnl/TRDRNA2_/TRDRNA2_38563_c0_seq1:105-1562(+)